MDEEAFVRLSVQHQLGDLHSARPVISAETRDRALAASSGSALAWDVAAAAPRPANGWHLRDGETGPGALAKTGTRGPLTKTVGTLEALLAAGADFDLLIDMQDRRMRNLVTPAGEVHPVIGFNRLAGAAGRVLWPLPLYHDLGSADFLGDLDPAAVPWHEKRDGFAWRGIHGGRANPHGDVRREGDRLRPLLRRLATGRRNLADTQRLLDTFPRHRFVARYMNDPRADVGFVDGNGFTLRDEPLLAPLERPRLTRQQMQGFRYLVVLRGLDVGSSFFWTMNSGSLGLVMETPFESFASVHFRPWEHYVPFREDLTDFEENLAWCAAHQDECQAMVRRAAGVCRLLARPDLRDRISREVVSGLRAALR